MAVHFQNPRNPLAAMWASAAERSLRELNPELTLEEIRKHPRMQGVYQHLDHLSRKERVAKPAAKTTGGAPDAELLAAQSAFASQEFFDLAVTTAGFSTAGNDLYESYIALLDRYNNAHNIDDFSTDDIGGFALCLIIWIGMTGLAGLSTLERSYLNYLIDQLPLTSAQKQQIKDFWASIDPTNFSVQYRDASQYPNYQTIPWKIPSGAQIVMLGDWGTALEDAQQFLYAIWKKAYQNNPGATIVFIHLGDIYYCGLPYECQNYFFNVFTTVGQQLATDLNDSRFNPNPPIFTLPGNHEYYSYGYGYFELLDALNQNVPGISHSNLYQQCSFFNLRTADGHWQFLGMDTGQADGNALLSALQAGGDMAKSWADENLPDWDWLQWITGLADSTYEDFVGPFAPTLRPNEVTWLKNKMDGFSGKTIMLSHHQLFSREAEIDHNSPQYINTSLDKTFRSYYKDQIAAWYWGHEHTFAVYLNGLFGLNKGRLLGSSSYETTDGDTPYANNYPMVPFAPNMTANLIKKGSNGLYYHAGAILTPNGSNMGVKYYQFPAWSQIDTPPSNPQLEEITAVAETITTSFTSLKPTWIGNKVISQDNVTTDRGTSITSWNDVLYMMYSDGRNDKAYVTVVSCNAATFQPESTNAAPAWGSPVNITISGSKIVTKNTPAVIAVNGKVYGFYVDSNGYIQGISCTAAATMPAAWSSIGHLTTKVAGAGPAVCLFQGRIYMVYRQNGSSNNLGWAFYDVNANTWTDLGAMKAGSTQFESPNTPAIAADAYHIYMTYQKKDKTDIRWAVGTPSSTAVSGTTNNITWTDKGDIESNSDGGQKNPDTNLGMTLSYSDGVFFLVYVSTNNNLTQCALTGTSQTSTGTWIGTNTVVINANSGSSSTAQTSQRPSLAVAAGGGFLVYRGNSHDEIYWAYY